MMRMSMVWLSVIQGEAAAGESGEHDEENLSAQRGRATSQLGPGEINPGG